MQPSRREFLQSGLGATALSCGGSIPAFIAQSAAAISSSSLPDRILVVVELDGGNDGLNTVVPYNDDVYRKSRPTLQIPKDSVLKIDDRIGLHPSLRGFSKMLDDGRLAIVQSVGYPNPDRSHFQSMSIWHTGDPDATLSTNGWLSGYIDAHWRPGQLDSVALHVDDAVLPQALKGSDIQVPSINEFEHLQRRVGVPASANPAGQLAALDRVIAEPRGVAAGGPRGQAGSHLQFIQRNTAVSFASSARLAELLRGASKLTSSFPDYDLGHRLSLISLLLRAELGVVIYYTRIGGFDTHIEQRFRHANLLTQLSNSVEAFFADLKRLGIADRVLMFMFSEFGRRLQENGAKGTDHGTAGPIFLAGGAVRPGLHGPYPNLVDLVDGDPKYAVDFRDIYATLLSKWLKVEHPFKPSSGGSSLELIQT